MVAHDKAVCPHPDQLSQAMFRLHAREPALVILITNQAVSGGASGSSAFLHRCPDISSGQFRSYSCTPSSLQGRRRMLHHPIRPRPTQACRRLPFHSTMTLLRDLASRFPQYRSSRADNYGRGSLLPSLSPGRAGQPFLLVIYLPAHRSGAALWSCRVRPLR